MITAGLAAMAMVTVATPVAAEGPARVSLPEPTGRSQLGTASLRLVDTSRPDPLREPEQPFRELMVSVFYPARDADRYPVAPQMGAGAAKAFDEIAGPANAGVPAGLVDWAATKSHAHSGAPVDRRGGPRPVLLYSPGVADPRTWNATLVEDLASRGYVVITIDHTYESAGVEFPGGRVARSVLLDREPTLDLMRTVLDARVADTRFVLDSLGEIGARVPGLRGAMDPDRIGMFGHSGGGFAALQTMHDDRRISAAVNLDGLLSIGHEDDGTNLSTVATEGVNRPFLLLGHEPGGHTARPSWGSLWAHSTGWKADLLLKNSGHASFTDAEALLPQVAAQVNLPEPVSKRIGAADPARVLAANRAYVAAFFDRFLRGADGPLLDGPSPAHPDVDFLR
ncbi:alpha/beta hydrolase family protein [Amycolatopsis anabasis]|uniref:alpha/beta hydrolase family protein n=1 Tax=Amycolatopsis anabasis TaxID=1840409 RepID=UPI00131B05CF|nr:hypothetical protein [Amycolatopsis anabasis]